MVVAFPPSLLSNELGGGSERRGDLTLSHPPPDRRGPDHHDDGGQFASFSTRMCLGRQTHLKYTLF
jgi:hypothetical protein